MEEERKNKSNTVLLTVIAVATLLVAVIGATFAYFTASISQAEDQSTVVVTSANLSITFADGNSTLYASTNVEPTKQVSGTYAALVDKSFTVTGTNTTNTVQNGGTASPAMKMPYDLYLIVTENTFVLENQLTGTSLSYVLTNNTGSGSTTGSINSTTSGKYGKIPSTCTVSENTYTCGSDAAKTYANNANANYDHLYTGSSLETGISLYAGSDTATATGLKGITLGHGFFPAQSSGVVHSYNLKIYFLEDNKNQDEDKRKSFEGYVAISAGNQATKISDTATASANTANEFTPAP